jgi:hypothetical protein
MCALYAGIHAFDPRKQDVDGRNESTTVRFKFGIDLGPTGVDL